MSPHQVIDPPGLAPARGFSHGLLATPGPILFVAGQIGWDEDSRLVSTSFVEQFDQALNNVMRVVADAGGSAEHVGRLTIYVTDKQAYLADLPGVGAAYRRHMGRHYPAMALVQVADLLEPGAQVEIEATAVLPPSGGES